MAMLLYLLWMRKPDIRCNNYLQFLNTLPLHDHA